MKIFYAYQRYQTIELFYEPLTLRRKDFITTLKQSTANNEEKSRRETMIATRNLTNEKELAMSYLENYVLLFTDLFHYSIDTCGTR